MLAYWLHNIKGYTRVEGRPFSVLATIKCKVCRQRRIIIDADHPCVDARSFPKRLLHKPFTEKNLSPEEFRALVEGVRAQLKTDQVLMSGAMVGPYQCRALVDLGWDIEWSGPGGPLFRKSLLARLGDLGFHFNSCEANIKGAKNLQTEYVFIEPPVVAILDERSLAANQIKVCKTCGGASGPEQDIPDDPVLFLDNVSTLPPLIRVDKLEDFIFLSPKFAEVLHKLRPSGVELVALGTWTNSFGE